MSKKIHMFDPEVYPRKLFVVSGKDAKKVVAAAFSTSSKEDLTIDDSLDTAGAATYPDVMFRDTGMLGVLVWILGDNRAKSLAHEAVHVVDAIFSQCRVDMHYEHDEHYAYMVGWVVDCLWQVATGKFKEYGELNNAKSDGEPEEGTEAGVSAGSDKTVTKE